MRRSRHLLKPIDGINAIPLIDIILVLLVIFMLCTPTVFGKLDINLPEAHSAKQSVDQGVVITITASGDYALVKGSNPQKMTLPALSETLAEMHLSTKTPIMVQADQKSHYQYLIDLLAILEAQGLSQVAFITQPSGTL